jgi:flagellar hook assembly protein FlgD
MTNISFQISESENVNISIYNMNGQLIETIVNDKMNPGSYSVSWNAKNVSSDLYFYKLTTGNKTGTNKMILIK